jgi:phosphate-selective porin OprO and OprP
MRTRIFRQWLLVLAVAVITLATALTDVRGQQHGQPQGYPIATGYSPQLDAGRNQAGVVPASTFSGQDNRTATDLAAADGVPPDRPPAPPAGASTDNLSKRVADLEARLQRASDAEKAAKQQAAGRPTIIPSGRIQFDAAGFAQDATSTSQFGNVLNAVGFRRARLALLGEAYNQFDYIIEMDFANRGADVTVNPKAQSTAFKDVYVQMRDLPVLENVRVGHFKEPFGLEQLTSDNYTTFMERSICDEGAFVPGRNDGIMAFGWSKNERVTWGAGLFTCQTGFDQPPLFQCDDGGLDATGRITYLPWYDEGSGGRGLLHVGADYAFRSGPNDTAIFTSTPESKFGPGIVNFTLTDANYWQVFDAEAALVYGPLSFQSEFYGANVNRTGGASNSFYGTYAYVSYFLTGESRPYNRKLGVFDRVRPYENFFHVRTCDGDVETGRGAWELAYRYSYVDMLDDLTVKGAGRAADHTIGVNWYMTPYTRVMFNYVHSEDDFNKAAKTLITGGGLDIIEFRMAMDF